MPKRIKKNLFHKKLEKEKKTIRKLSTYSSTSKNLSPSDAKHLPRKLNIEPLIKIGCCCPD